MSEGADRSRAEAAELESFAEQEQRALDESSGEEQRREADRFEEADHRPDPLSAPSGEPHEHSRRSGGGPGQGA
jgi:hypothetical protein